MKNKTRLKNKVALKGKTISKVHQKAINSFIIHFTDNSFVELGTDNFHGIGTIHIEKNG